jgi:hypothetical protein
MSRNKEFGAGHTPAVPVVRWDEVTHIGTLNPKNRKDWSLEGDGLSVSRHPDAWRKIAQVSGDEWAISRPDGPLSFIDAHKVPQRTHRDIESWATRNNFGQRVPVWHVDAYDDEYEDTFRSTYDSEEEAMDEASDPAAVTRGRQFKFFDEHAPRGTSLVTTRDALLSKWTNDQTPMDGVWWADDMAPDMYSAPRGVIVPRQIPNLKKIRKPL